MKFGSILLSALGICSFLGLFSLLSEELPLCPPLQRCRGIQHNPRVFRRISRPRDCRGNREGTEQAALRTDRPGRHGCALWHRCGFPRSFSCPLYAEPIFLEETPTRPRPKPRREPKHHFQQLLSINPCYKYNTFRPIIGNKVLHKGGHKCDTYGNYWKLFNFLFRDMWKK